MTESPPESSPTKLQSMLRRELSALAAEKTTLGVDDTARRGQVRVRTDEIRAELHGLTTADPETIARWTQRAVDRPVEPQPKPIIPSPMESGSM